jgi:hypothetical protein
MGRAEFVRADIRNPFIAKVIRNSDVDTVVHWRRFDWTGARIAGADFTVTGQHAYDCRDVLAMRNHIVAICQYPDEHLRSRLYMWPSGGGEPVFEDDVVSVEAELLAERPLATGGRLLAVAVRVEAERSGVDAPSAVLDWRPVLFAP